MENDDLDKVKKDLKNTGIFSSDELSTLVKLGTTDCPLCVKGMGNIATFTPCGHRCCSTCLDTLADNYEGVEALFLCPVCNVKVVDVLFQ